MWWPDHSRGHLNDVELLSSIKKLLSPSKTNRLISWAHDSVASWSSYIYIYKHDIDLAMFNSAVAEASGLHYAAMLTLPQVRTWLLESGCDVNHDSGFGTPIHCALLGREALMRHGCDPLRDKWKRIDSEQRCVLKILLEAGADPNCYFDTPTDHVSPLFISLTSFDSESAVRLLQKGGRLDERCITAMEDAIKNDDKFDNLSNILYHVSDKNVQVEHRRRIDEIALKLEKPISRHLVRKSDIQDGDVQVSKIEYELSLRTAAKFGQLETITNLLKERDFDPTAAEDYTGYTALHYAVMHDHVEVVKLLLANGAQS